LTVAGLELRPLGRAARRKSLYRLRYPGSRTSGVHFLMLSLDKPTRPEANNSQHLGHAIPCENNLTEEKSSVLGDISGTADFVMLKTEFSNSDLTTYVTFS
jgi:hypothetical protein